MKEKEALNLTMDQRTYQKLNYIAKKQNKTVEQILIEMMRKEVNKFEEGHGIIK